MRYVAYVVLLVALWLLAWGQVSMANIVSGAAVAAALLLAFPPRRRAGIRVSPLGVARLTLHLLGQLVVSNILVTREIVSPRSRVRSGVLAHRMPDASDELLALVANVIALTPGTMTVEATRDPAVLYVHFLLLDDVDKARRAIGRLEMLGRDALSEPRPTPQPLTHTTPEGPL
jgi:multicomponent Na+:H+ antiporter subunit E